MKNVSVRVSATTAKSASHVFHRKGSRRSPWDGPAATAGNGDETTSVMRTLVARTSRLGIDHGRARRSERSGGGPGRHARHAARRRDPVPADRLRLLRESDRRVRTRAVRRDPVPRAVRAADLAAESVRSRAARHHGRAPGAGLHVRGRPSVLARHGRPGTRHAVRDLLRAANLAGGRCGEHDSRAVHRPDDGTHRRLPRRAHRNAHHADRRHPAVVPGDPDRADPDRRAGAGHGQGDRRAGHDPVGVLRAHRSQRGAGRAAQGVHGGGALPGASARRASCSATCCRTACRR